MPITRRRLAVVAAAAVGTAGVAAGAVAATQGGPGTAASDLAAAINKRAGTSITGADVTGAFQDLLKQRLDQAVADGRITQAQADAMLQRAKDAPGLPGLGGPGFGGPGHGLGADVLGPVAKKLGVTEQQLRTRLRAGKSLADVATAEGVSRADLLAVITTALRDAGVPSGRVAALAKRIADGTPPGPPLGRRHGGGPWGLPPGP
jgi:hypothetical protein